MPASIPESCLEIEIDPVHPLRILHPATWRILPGHWAGDKRRSENGSRVDGRLRHWPRGAGRRGRPTSVFLAVIGAIILIVAALPATGAGVGCEGEWANSPICRERQAAVEERARAEAMMERLPHVTEAPWDPLEFEAAEALYQEGMALYRDEYFGDAAAKFQSATERLFAIEQELQALIAQRLAAADASLDEEDFEAAAAGYHAVLDLLPESSAASVGLSTARQGMTARKLLAQARQSLDQGDLEAAESRLDAIPTGLLSDGVGQARRQIRASRQQDRMSRSMSRGFRHLDRAEWQEAEAAFTEALRTDPASTAARDALEDLRRRRTDAELTAYRTRLEAQVAAENWLESGALLERMQALDPDDAAIARDLSRIGRLADVEARIDGYLQRPQRLSAKGVRDQATALVDATADPETYGARIIQKRDRLRQSLTTWTTPVEMTIRSDDRTEVHIRPGRVLGKFKERRLEVFPGDYILSGRRVGYREVSLRVAVPPGTDALSFEVVCHERF